MPVLEAPKELDDSSPDESFQQQPPPPPPPPLPEQRTPPRRYMPQAMGLLAISTQPLNLQRLQRSPTEPQPIRTTPHNRNRMEILNNSRNVINVRSSVNNVYDRDVEETEEENYYPAYVHLLPQVVTVQQQHVEPTLEELLRRVIQRDDLENVLSVRLRVLSSHVSLSHMALFTPRLQQLDLSGSVLYSLRDLGYDLIHLTHLNVSNCGLNSLDGTSGFPALRVLMADNNMIQRMGPLIEMPDLERLSLCNNRISELFTLTFLGHCRNLVELDVRGNPICHLALYRQHLERNIRSLQVLDGVPSNSRFALNSTVTDSDDVSSLSSNSLSMLLSEQRPATAPWPIHPTLPIENNQRSDSASSSSSRSTSSSLYSDSPVAGSILSLARNTNRRRRRQHNANAWVSLENSSASLSSGHNSTRPPSSLSSEVGVDDRYIFLEVNKVNKCFVDVNFIFIFLTVVPTLLASSSISRF